MVESFKCNSEIVSTSSSQKVKGFHEKYLAICKSKNIQPLPEVKVKQRNNHVLDFHADRVKVRDWMAISSALENDKSLHFVAIRLRKNDGFVLEEVDSVKKAKLLTSQPVIYSKFLFKQLVEALQTVLMQNGSVEILMLEGLPVYGRYMMPLAKGLYSNNSLKLLSFARSNIGDEGCEILCSNIKHLTNIESINLSQCSLTSKGATSVKEYVKFQKIHRLSEAWIQSLRYRNVESIQFVGLRKVFLNNNPEIGDDGMELLINELFEDVWIKEIEMQNCGLSDVTANRIINCLSVNKTITNFNVANNSDMPEHMFRHIMVNLGKIIDNENSDSSEGNLIPKKFTKVQLLDKIKFLEEQLESEMYRRKQAEELNDQLHKQVQKQMCTANSFSIPDGYTLMENDTFDKLVKKNSVSQRTAVPNVGVKLRRRRKNIFTLPKTARKVEIIKPQTVTLNQPTQFLKSTDLEEKKNIGDFVSKSSIKIQQHQDAYSGEMEMEENKQEIMKIFVTPKKPQSDDITDIRTIFRKSTCSIAQSQSSVHSYSDN